MIFSTTSPTVGLLRSRLSRSAARIFRRFLKLQRQFHSKTWDIETGGLAYFFEQAVDLQARRSSYLSRQSARSLVVLATQDSVVAVPTFRMNAMNKPENQVLRVLEDYKAAVFAKDIDAFVALYDTDVQVFDAWSVWTYVGITSWRKVVTDWLSSLGTDRVVVEFNEAEAIIEPSLAVIHAIVTFKGVSPDGVVLRSLNNRLTMTLRQKNGGWKIIHQHTSSPIDLKTAKAILHR
jgi:ketosteroid isomerase-like protein